MKIVFLSNFFNHHQKPLWEEVYNLIGNDFTFIETSQITEERLKMGWGEKEIPNYVKNYNESIEDKNYCLNLIDNADVVVFGSAPYTLIENRLKQEKLTFIYSERVLKKGFSYLKWPVRLYKFYKMYGQYKNLYLLSASAYSSWDFNRLGVFKNKAYKWGYFPVTKEYKDVDALIKNKEKNSILWCGRFIEWKHPEYAIEVAKKLKEDGYDFSLNVIGTGELDNLLKETAIKNGLVNNVKFLGSMKPTEVREIMEKSSIYLFTSDKGEGWGAVLNESMNSACAVVTSHAIGATPFLVKDRENGLIFKSEDVNDLYNKVKYLLDNEDFANNLGKKAYETITTEWNAKVAASRLLELIINLQKDNKCDIYASGPCSKAEVLKNNWYKNK